MSCRVEVIDEVASGLPLEVIARLVEDVLAAEGRDDAVAVALVDEGAIATLNERYRDEPGPTDVLSFPETASEQVWVRVEGWDDDAADEAGCGLLGEMVVCPRVVSRYAAEEGRDRAVQLGWTVIHGALHLLGYDHETDEGEMRAREQVLLARFAARVSRLAFPDGL